MTPEALITQYPEVTLLDSDQPEAFVQYLNSRGLLDADEKEVVLERPGDGNMNKTFRVKTHKRSFIIKQAYPWVAKYPQIEAPWDRIIREARFFQTVSEKKRLGQQMPQLLDLDIVSRVAQLSDLGEGQDATFIYSGEPLQPWQITAAASWLSALHRADFPKDCCSALTNRDMRALNHAHVFELPLAAENGFPLDNFTPGLQALADSLKANTDYCQEVTRLGQDYYLADGPTLIHGDYFPGSWYLTGDQLWIIDPEFCFFGRAEFDFGIALAHLHLAMQNQEIEQLFWENYEASDSFSPKLAVQMAGVEIMRRLIGIAQLPLSHDLATKQKLLEKSVDFVLNPEKALTP